MANPDLEALEPLCPELRAFTRDHLTERLESDPLVVILAACIVRLGAENEPLRQFAEYCLDQYSWFNEPDGGDLQEKAIELGLVELREIDPEDSIDGEDEHYFCKWTPDNRKERG